MISEKVIEDVLSKKRHTVKRTKRMSIFDIHSELQKKKKLLKN